MSKEILKVDQLSVNYGAIKAVRDVSFDIKEGEIVTLIGANGAGKSTILKTISGLLKPANGEIVFLGRSLAKLTAPKIVAAGVSQVPEGRRIFAGMTVKENLQLGAYLRKDKDGVEKDMEAMFKRFPILKERQKQDAATLSGGEQQMLAVGRAIMSDPELLMLDEPSMGLAPLVVAQVMDVIAKIRDMGITVLLVEQNASMALRICDRAYVLNTGLNTGMVTNKDENMQELADALLREAYLGAKK